VTRECAATEIPVTLLSLTEVTRLITSPYQLDSTDKPSKAGINEKQPSASDFRLSPSLSAGPTPTICGLGRALNAKKAFYVDKSTSNMVSERDRFLSRKMASPVSSLQKQEGRRPTAAFDRRRDPLLIEEIGDLLRSAIVDVLRL
jgi:hypothetical protein